MNVFTISRVQLEALISCCWTVYTMTQYRDGSKQLPRGSPLPGHRVMHRTHLTTFSQTITFRHHLAPCTWCNNKRSLLSSSKGSRRPCHLQIILLGILLECHPSTLPWAHLHSWYCNLPQQQISFETTHLGIQGSFDSWKISPPLVLKLSTSSSADKNARWSNQWGHTLRIECEWHQVWAIFARIDW